jgi:hypothetical protein
LEGRELLSISFAPAVTFPVGLRPVSIVTADVDNDAKQDIVVLNQGQIPNRTSSVSVLFGKGDGSFQPAVTTSLLAGATAVATGDFDRDGQLDLAITSGLNNSVEVLRGNGDGTFQDNHLIIPVGNQGTFTPSIQSVVVGDFLHNGKLGLAVVNPGSNTLSVLLGNGDGTFQPRVDLPVGSSPVSVVAVDLGHGNIDLAIANRASRDLSILVGNGDGTFQPAQTVDVKFQSFGIDSQPFTLKAGDFDRDGKLDLVISQFVGFDVGESFVTVLRGKGDGTFQAPIHTDIGVNLIGLAVVDFNRDGKLDLAAADSGFVTGAAQVFLGNGDGTFGNRNIFPTNGGAAFGVATGDFNRDGRADLAVANTFSDDVRVLLNTSVVPLFGDSDGDGDVDANDFAAFRTAFGGSSAIFDFDGDGVVNATDFAQFRLRFGTRI